MEQKDIEDVIMFQIERASKMAKQFSQHEFDKHDLGITVDQWILLKIIHEHENLSQRDLAKYSTRDPASITRTLDLLENKELIARLAIPNNRRQYEIKLTKHGKKFVQKNLPMIKKHRAASIKGFTKKELKSLKEMLVRIQNNMKRAG